MRADWYFPNGPEPSTNGFAPDGMWLGGVPLQLAVAELFMGDRAALTTSAGAAAGHAVTLPRDYVLAGHSLGGVFVTAVAGDLADRGATENLAGRDSLRPRCLRGPRRCDAPTALTRLPADLPVLLVGSPPYYWNQLGAAADALVAARPGKFVGVILDHGSHADYVQGGNPLMQFIENAMVGFSKPQNIEAAQILAAGWITDIPDAHHRADHCRCC